MKKVFSLFFYLTLLSVSLNTFAYGTNVKVLSSKIEMSPGMEGGFLDKEPQTPANLTANGGARAYAQAKPAYGKKGDNIRIDGGHGFAIENKSGKVQGYLIEYKLSLSDGRFIRKADNIQVENNSIARGSATSYTTQYFPNAGTYSFIVETSVRGEYSDYKSDNSYVQVR